MAREIGGEGVRRRGGGEVREGGYRGGYLDTLLKRWATAKRDEGGTRPVGGEVGVVVVGGGGRKCSWRTVRKEGMVFVPSFVRALSLSFSLYRGGGGKARGKQKGGVGGRTRM